MEDDDKPLPVHRQRRELLREIREGFKPQLSDLPPEDAAQPAPSALTDPAPAGDSPPAAPDEPGVVEGEQ